MARTRGITSRLWSIPIQWNARSVCYFPGHFVKIAPSHFTSQCHRDLAVEALNRSRTNGRLVGYYRGLGMIVSVAVVCCRLVIRDLGFRKFYSYPKSIHIGIQCHYQSSNKTHKCYSSVLECFAIILLYV